MEQTENLSVQTTKVQNPRLRMLKTMLERLWQNKLAVFGGVVTFLLIFTALFATWLAPHDPTEQNYSAVLQAPSSEYWFGTDNLGRDIFSRVIYGAQVSLQAGLISVGIALIIGVPIGLISGYYRGFIDEYIIMRMTDAMLSIPALVLALALAAVLGAGLTNAMIAIGLVLTPNFVRLIRGEVLAHREKEYVEAGKASGISDFSIILKHILPNTIAPIMVQATLAIAAAIIVEASLSYLGLGTQPPNPSWGSMLATGQGYLDSAPWIALFPGALIFITVISINLFGDGIRDMLDPKMK
ncbi:peptide/nickel transport system permease protein [Alkalibacillus filiformis]|uniref:Peptide/nickel transport system permease protein n=1 Tax=Alkalibacillus filiformis TaxID=200990 RepID=A0ABU0DSK4_9BACI|nr:ABC transporter permease [Alkalibacillus filiformis]MDQ0351419.1 peptide/nickel transport system permease protein [Alkalibacillus filiformis]